MNTACQTLLNHDPTRHDSLLLLANLNVAIFQHSFKARSVTSALENTPPEAARANFWLFTPKTVLTTITTLGSGEH